MIAGLFTLLFSGALGRVHGGHPGTCGKCPLHASGGGGTRSGGADLMGGITCLAYHRGVGRAGLAGPPKCPIA